MSDVVGPSAITTATIMMNASSSSSNTPRSNSTPSHSGSRASSNSELEKEIAQLNVSGLSGSTTVSSSGGSAAGGDAGKTNGNSNTLKKTRVSSSRTPTAKARRIRFYRNGDRFYAGIVIAVSSERYRSFESLVEDLTRLMEDRISGAVRNIHTTAGKRITQLDEFEDGTDYVCLCNKETFKRCEYTAQPIKPTGAGNRLSRHMRSGSPLVTNGSAANHSNVGLALNATGTPPQTSYTNGSSNGGGGPPADACVRPRIVTLIRNGTKPRRVQRLLLNKRNSPSFDHVLTAITQCVKLDSGCVRKVYTLSGTAVLRLADFFDAAAEDVFFAYGTERVQPDVDFQLDADEQKAVSQTRRVIGRNGASTGRDGPKPRMPVKNSVNLHNTTYDASTMEKEHREALLDTADDAENAAEPVADEHGIDAADLPASIQAQYTLGPIVGDGNFAVVLRVLRRDTGKPFALKIIDKSKCKGKEHYIDAEVRVMKKLRHPHIMALVMDVDTPANMFLVLEYVSGGDLFDAITTATRFTESQARIMMRHLASAMAYLHSLGIVHRDIKPENLLVELDQEGQVTELKLADFGLACEVVQPLLAVCGTPTYVAPEILLETGYGLKIDVWAAGIILYILLCGFPPFVAPDNQQEPLFDSILSGVYEFPEPYWNDIGDDVRDLIANMLQSDPDLRFASEDVLDHSWTMGSCKQPEYVVGEDFS